MKTFRLLLLGICTFLFIGCQEKKTVTEQDTAPLEVTTIYLIRHAEKDRKDPSDPDPELNQKGLGRAMHWAEILSEVPLQAIYSTDYDRTSMTAAPTAVKQDLTVTYYDPESLNIEEFKYNNSGGNVLVVGHSNSIPAMVNKLIGEEKYASLDDYDNGSLFIVQFVGSETTDMRLHFNCNCPR